MYMSMCVCVCVRVYVYIYIEREREHESAKEICYKELAHMIMEAKKSSDQQSLSEDPDEPMV